MIRKCNENDFTAIHSIINNAAQAYRGIIPEDCWKDPYMTIEELKYEIDSGITFWGYEEDRELLGVMGIQPVQGVTLIRHSYVLTERQKQGIGSKLLSFLYKKTNSVVLIGTWETAVWAIEFYGKLGFRLVSPEEKNQLLKKYWSISDRQRETSVVLADERWFNLTHR